MNMQDELFYKQVEINYKFENKLKRNKNKISNLFLSCTCSTILSTTYTLLRISTSCVIICSTVSYMSFLTILKQLIKRKQIERQHTHYNQLIKSKKIVKISSS